jgi:hypothetical protein
MIIRVCFEEMLIEKLKLAFIICCSFIKLGFRLHFKTTTLLSSIALLILHPITFPE